MYAEEKSINSKIPELADKIAHEILNNFEPMEQNELLRTIYNIVYKARQEMIMEEQEKLKHLEESLSTLHTGIGTERIPSPRYG